MKFSETEGGHIGSTSTAVAQIPDRRLLAISSPSAERAPDRNPDLFGMPTRPTRRTQRLPPCRRLRSRPAHCSLWRRAFWSRSPPGSPALPQAVPRAWLWKSRGCAQSGVLGRALGEQRDWARICRETCSPIGAVSPPAGCRRREPFRKHWSAIAGVALGDESALAGMS
jgi:hypothetical protein